MPSLAFDDPRIREELWRVGGDFIRECFQAWTWWITLTFNRPVSPEHADASFGAWAKRLARELVDDHVGVVWVRERDPRNHFHALLAMPAGKDLTRRELQDAWRSDSSAGYSVIVRYDAALGAAFYIAKKDGWTHNVACPRHRRCRRPGGCVVARSPW